MIETFKSMKLENSGEIMRNFDKAIITCAVTGAIHIPTMSPHLPITPEEIAQAGIDAAEAGASIIHIHVRDPETGEPITDLDLFREVARKIQDETDAIVQPTTGGAPTMPLEERTKTVPELEPEMASCNMGSFNFGLYQLKNHFDEFQYEWELDYLEETRDLIFPNSFADLEHVLQLFNEHGTKPELECYDAGHLYNIKHFLDRGLLETPLRIQFVLGIHGGMGADSENLNYMIRTAEKLFGDQYSFSVIGAGRMQFPLSCQAISRGGHVRVGLEDSLYIRKGELAESNEQMVSKMASLIEELSGREIAKPDDVREFFNLDGSSEVAF
jgi:uncharacterized protein (DUF849 family)